jgi:hypothetical protein
MPSLNTEAPQHQNIETSKMRVCVTSFNIQVLFFIKTPKHRLTDMSEETSTSEQALGVEIKADAKTGKKQISVQELVDSLKSVQDDIGQISELTSEEELLVTEFFASLMKLMRPLTPSIQVSTSILPEELGTVSQASLDETGQLTLLYEDGRMDLKNLSEQKYRDLMITVIEDVMPKFKQLTNAQKRKVEGRIKFLSAITKEMQKISKALFPTSSESQK